MERLYALYIKAKDNDDKGNEDDEG